MRAALEAATRLPIEVRGQIEAISTVTGGSEGGPSPYHGGVGQGGSGSGRGSVEMGGTSVQLSHSGSGDGSAAQ